MVAMLLSAINGTIFLVGIATSSLTPLFEQVTLVIWSCRLRIKEPFGFNGVTALCVWGKIYCTMWCLSPPRCINGTGDLSRKFSEVQMGEGERLPAMDLNHIFGEKQYLLCTKTVDSVGGALWLAAPSPTILCYSPPINSGGICARVDRRWIMKILCKNKWVKIIFLRYIILLF